MEDSSHSFRYKSAGGEKISVKCGSTGPSRVALAQDPSLFFDMPVVRAGKAVLRHVADPKISNEAKNILRLLLFPLIIARPVRAQSHQYRSESHAI